MIKSITSLNLSLNGVMDRIDKYIASHPLDKLKFLDIAEKELLYNFKNKDKVLSKLNKFRRRHEWYQNLSLNTYHFDKSDEYGFLHSQINGTCWIDAVSQILLNTEIVSSIFKRNVFDFVMHDKKKILYPVRPKMIDSYREEESLFFYFYSWYLVKSAQLIIMNNHDNKIDSSDPELKIGNINTINSIIENRIAHIVKKLYCSKYDKTKIYVGGAPATLLKYFIEHYHLPISMKRFININYNYGASHNPWIGLRQGYSKDIPSIGWTHMFAIEPLKFRIDPNLYAAIINFKVGIKEATYHAIAFVRMNGKFYIIDNNLSKDPRKKKAIEIKPKIEEHYFEFDLTNFGSYTKNKFKIIEHTAITINLYNRSKIYMKKYEPTIIKNRETSTLFLEPLVRDRCVEYLSNLKESYHYLNHENYLDDFIDKLNLRKDTGEYYKSKDFKSLINLF